MASDEAFLAVEVPTIDEPEAAEPTNVRSETTVPDPIERRTMDDVTTDTHTTEDLR